MAINSSDFIVSTPPIVGGVIVAYNPDESEFHNVVKAVSNQLDFVVIVNNSIKPLMTNFHEFISINNQFKIEVIENAENYGVAKALNIGLKVLVKRGCSNFLMLDQDSLIPEGMVSTLVKSLDELNKDKFRVAAIGPAYSNCRLNKCAPFIQFGKLGIKKIPIDEKNQLIETHFLITSGTLLTLDALNNVGLMEEDLFIDYVDTEWCLRALANNYKIYGNGGVQMEHSLGDSPLVIFGIKFPMHSPLRHYYLVRNAIHLIKKSYIPLNWRMTIFFRMLQSFIFYSLVPSNRLEHFNKMVQGAKNGLRGILGPYPDNLD